MTREDLSYMKDIAREGSVEDVQNLLDSDTLWGYQGIQLQDCLALISAGIKESAAETQAEKEKRVTIFRQGQLQSGEVNLSAFFALANEKAAGTGRQQTLSPHHLYNHSKLKDVLKALPKLPEIDGKKFWVDVKKEDGKINVNIRYGKKYDGSAFSSVSMNGDLLDPLVSKNVSIFDGDFSLEINSATISGRIGMWWHNDGFSYKAVDDALVVLGPFVGHKAPSQVAELFEKVSASKSLVAKVRAKIPRRRSKQIALR